MVILLCWLGTISVMLALIPAVAILPILLYIAMLIGSQAFQETPRSHGGGVVGTRRRSGDSAPAGAVRSEYRQSHAW